MWFLIWAQEGPHTLKAIGGAPWWSSTITGATARIRYDARPLGFLCNAADVNDDGTVNVLDLIELLLAFGTACP